MKKLKLVTHSGKFHADDTFASATLSLLFEKTGQDFEIIRSRNPKDTESADVVYDNGNIYDPDRKIFDHHQQGGAGARQNGVPYAAFGLIWKHYGQDLIKNYFTDSTHDVGTYNLSAENISKIAEIIDREVVQPIDAADTGYDDYHSTKNPDLQTYLLDSVASAFNPTLTEGYEKSLELFQQMVLVAKQILERELVKAKNKVEGFAKVEQAYEKAEDKRIIILEVGYPWREILVSKPEPLYVIFPTIDDNGFVIQAVPQKMVGYEVRKPFPENWRGKVDLELEKVSSIVGAKFCHSRGFLAVTKTKEQAIELTKKALNN